MRVLVTGSSGFLGHNVANHLASLPDYEVTGFDLLGGRSDVFPSIRGDLCDRRAVTDAVRNADIVVHFGGFGDVDAVAATPDEALAANVGGTTNVAVAALANGATIVYASSWEVYGPVEYAPIDEAHPCKPKHLYAVTKLLGEHVLRAAYDVGAPVAILRLGTAYGPGMRPNAVISRFRDAGRRGEPITVQGTGGQFRQFLHTDDLARAVEAACESDDAYLLANIVPQQAFTILSLAEQVATHYSVPVEFTEARQEDPESAWVNADEAETVLGWKAEVAFVDGLASILSDD